MQYALKPFQLQALAFMMGERLAGAVAHCCSDRLRPEWRKPRSPACALASSGAVISTFRLLLRRLQARRTGPEAPPRTCGWRCRRRPGAAPRRTRPPHAASSRRCSTPSSGATATSSSPSKVRGLLLLGRPGPLQRLPPAGAACRH
jgi:hypothetical protein